MYKATIIADSIHNGSRITTMQLTYPRFIHSEMLTHRVFSRNASSSRAIPVERLVQASLENMVYPIRWGKNQAGMQAKQELLDYSEGDRANSIWHNMAIECAKGAKALAELGVHKQWANRPLEWFGNITVVVTATEWDNFFELRNHEMAQPEIHYLATLMLEAMEDSLPEDLEEGEWHLPYITEDEKDSYSFTLVELQKISTARCARVSYFTQEGKIPTREEDLLLYDRLVGSVPLHASPCEHQATPSMGCEDKQYEGNFVGWVQFRKLLEEEFS